MLPRQLTRLFALVGILATYASFLSAQRVSEADLRAKVASRGTIRVIVHLDNTGYRHEGRLHTKSAIMRQHRRISEAQDRLLERMANLGRSSIKKYRRLPFLAMEVDPDALNDLLQNPEVSTVEEDVPIPLLDSKSTGTSPIFEVSPNDLDFVGPALVESTTIIGADRAWSTGYTGAGYAVAILDSGVDKTHSFLSGKVVSEACYSTNDLAFSSSSTCPAGVEATTAAGSGVNCSIAIPGCDHGTHVAGIAAGKGVSFSGVGKEADLIAVQVFSRFDSTAYCGRPPCILSWTSDQILGLERVLELADTIDIAAVNMSLGGGRYTDPDSCDANNGAIKTAIDNLRSVGIATVIASGNNGYTNAISAPGCISSAVSVGSTNDIDAISRFSNEASFLSLYAPGEAINSSVPFDNFAVKNGTSMATPHVTGAWALLKQRAPNATVNEALRALQTTGIPITSSLGTWITPRVEVDSALDAVTQPIMSIEAPNAGISVPIPFSINGWAIDRAVLNGTGIDMVHIWAFPDGGAPPVFLGSATLGFDRPDVASSYGAQFAPSGYELRVTTYLPDGSYAIRAFGRSLLTGTFDAIQEIQLFIDSSLGPDVQIGIDKPLIGATLRWPFDITGWAADPVAPNGTGVDLIHIWAFADGGGAPVFIAGAIPNLSRPDVASALGDPRFEPSGFAVSSPTPLPDGNYALRIYARSTVTGTWADFVEVPVDILNRTLVSIDQPTGNASVLIPFEVNGWAVHTVAPAGIGVDMVHVWAFSDAGGPPVFLGGATPSLSRPEVAYWLGASRFEYAGFQLQVSTPLPVGTYTIRAYARNTVDGTFDHDNVGTVSIDVTGGSDPQMAVETPVNQDTISTPFTIKGWAVDLSAPSGVGVDLVHVWAFPNDGSPHFFLGGTVPAESRPDVEASYGSQFRDCGFQNVITTPLPPGGYTLRVYARSTVTNTFNNFIQVQVDVP